MTTTLHSPLKKPRGTPVQWAQVGADINEKLMVRRPNWFRPYHGSTAPARRPSGRPPVILKLNPPGSHRNCLDFKSAVCTTLPRLGVRPFAVGIWPRPSPRGIPRRAAENLSSRTTLSYERAGMKGARETHRMEMLRSRAEISCLAGWLQYLVYYRRLYGVGHQSLGEVLKTRPSYRARGNPSVFLEFHAASHYVDDGVASGLNSRELQQFVVGAVGFHALEFGFQLGEKYDRLGGSRLQRTHGFSAKRGSGIVDLRARDKLRSQSKA
ncbi:hypothetical protein FB451DRAFT_1188261 [Mycena latifolia]|nr:hypothetical protein FB451DRAFT_1188261 [Mycena latifolia]